MAEVGNIQKIINLILGYIGKSRMMNPKLQEDYALLEEALAILDKQILLDLSLIGDYFQLSIGVFDMDGTVLYLNKANEDCYGIPKDEPIGKNAEKFAVNEEYMSNAITMDVLKTGKSYSAITIPRRTGKQLLQKGAPIMSPGGNQIGVLVIDYNISEFMELKDALYATQNRLSELESLTDLQGNVIKALTEQVSNSVGVICESTRMRLVLEQAINVAKSNATILILGETGSGKEVFANVIHNHSDRKDKPYIKVNCSAIPENLFESEMFGYERGAFTGADPKGKSGLFELANGGTILLDEIGEIPLSFQAKLLRAIQNKQIRRVGGKNLIDLDVRIIAATNKNLRDMVDKGKFREDLFYRINVIPLSIPPLRARKEDITPLILYNLKRFNNKYNKNIAIDPYAMFKLQEYPWPGNIRELENIIERWVAIFDPYAVVRWENVHYFVHPDYGGAEVIMHPYKGRTMDELVDEYQRDLLEWASSEFTSPQEIADALAVDRTTIVRNAKRLGVSLPNGRYQKRAK